MREPDTAPLRGDLPYLRRRVRSVRPSTTAVGSAPSVGAFIAANGSGRPQRRSIPATPPVPPAPTPAAPSTSLDLAGPEAPKPAMSLDLGVVPATSVRVSTSLDLDPAPTAPSTPSSATSLDLSDAAPSAPAQPQHRPRTGGPTRAAYEPVRSSGRERTILTVHRPSITLSRVQSGVGTLTFQAACAPGLGDVRLGCFYELNSGWSSTVQRVDGNREGPRHSVRPALVSSHEQFEQIGLDLRQSRLIRRALLYLYSQSRTALPFAGTFVATTFGGASIEVPLELGTATPTLAAMSLYNVDGEFVLRAEMEPISGSVRDIGKAYGYDRITWIDDSTPTD